ncbi:hypothetical protein [Nonomuraea sp. 10N515B]|uniref:hypothetical protein n=1 Tax=Nonomuraea sp. 10N515B TaxID=3457422 RepID=UPI003FCCDE55
MAVEQAVPHGPEDEVREALVPPISSVGQGAEATLRLVNGLDGVTGRYFDQQRESRADAQAYDLEARKRLRERSDDLIRRALS